MYKIYQRQEFEDKKIRIEKKCKTVMNRDQGSRERNYNSERQEMEKESEIIKSNFKNKRQTRSNKDKEIKEKKK